MKAILLTATESSSQGPPKTASHIIRYRPDEVVAIIDPANQGKTSQQLFGIGGDIPVIASLNDAPHADTLIIGVATIGGKVPTPMRPHILEGIGRKMTIISGLHEFLAHDPEFSQTARTHGAKLIDVRRNNERQCAHRQNINEKCLRIHTVGHDCNVGKMLTCLELTKALRQAGQDAKFVATGQSGIMVEGDGCPIDAVVSDFINGAAERLVLKNQHHKILLIEGQGSIVHPRYSAVTLGLLHGCMPHGLILCYEMGRNTIYGFDNISIPPLSTLINLYETMANIMHPCRVLGIAMNSRRFTEPEALRERDKLEDQLNLPVTDILRHGPDKLTHTITNALTHLP